MLMTLAINQNMPNLFHVNTAYDKSRILDSWKHLKKWKVTIACNEIYSNKDHSGQNDCYSIVNRDSHMRLKVDVIHNPQFFHGWRI